MKSFATSSAAWSIISRTRGVSHTAPCRPPRKSSRPLESLQKTRYATSRNPRNGAAILAVPRLNLLARPVAATKREGFGWPRAVSPQLLAVSIRCYVICVTSPRFAEKLQIKNLCSMLPDGPRTRVFAFAFLLVLVAFRGSSSTIPAQFGHSFLARGLTPHPGQQNLPLESAPLFAGNILVQKRVRGCERRGLGRYSVPLEPRQFN